MARRSLSSPWSSGLAALGLLLLVRPAAAGQDPRLRARLDLATAERVEQLVDSAKSLGLPTEPLVQKALEGRSKGASGDRIKAAVTQLLGNLVVVRKELGQASSDELQAGVLWLTAGGSADQLGTLRRRAPDRSLAVPIAVSAEMLRRGWSPDEAATSLGRLLDANLTDTGFLAMRSEVELAVKGGTGVVPAIRAQVTRLTGARP